MAQLVNGKELGGKLHLKQTTSLRIDGRFGRASLGRPQCEAAEKFRVHFVVMA